MVYVDTLFKVKRTKYCHMVADTVQELKAFAAQCKFSPGWFEYSNSGVPHYDLNEQMRAVAVANGAIEVTRKELLIIGRRTKT